YEIHSRRSCGRQSSRTYLVFPGQILASHQGHASGPGFGSAARSRGLCCSGRCAGAQEISVCVCRRSLQEAQARARCIAAHHFSLRNWRSLVLRLEPREMTPSVSPADGSVNRKSEAEGPMTPADAQRRYMENLQGEVDSATLYRTLSDIEKNPQLAKVYERLASVEEAHAEFWKKRLETETLDRPA